MCNTAVYILYEQYEGLKYNKHFKSHHRWKTFFNISLISFDTFGSGNVGKILQFCSMRDLYSSSTTQM